MFSVRCASRPATALHLRGRSLSLRSLFRKISLRQTNRAALPSPFARSLSTAFSSSSCSTTTIRESIPAHHSLPSPLARQTSMPAQASALTLDIHACQTSEQVLALFESCRASGSVQKTTNDELIAFLVSLKSKHADGTIAAADPRLAALVEAAASRFFTMNLRATAITVSCADILGVRLRDEQLDDFWKASGKKLRAAENRALFGFLKSCSNFKLMPPASWIDEFWKCSGPQLSSVAALELDSTLFACIVLGLVPPRAWMAKFWPATEALHAACEAHTLSGLLGSCAELGLLPPATWMRSFWAASYAVFPDTFDKKPSRHVSRMRQTAIGAARVLDGRVLEANRARTDRSDPDRARECILVLRPVLAHVAPCRFTLVVGS